MRAVKAAQLLQFVPNKSAHLVRKLIRSAAANAVENHSMNEEDLVITRAFVDEGARLKRIQARAMGRANRILKRTCHITVVVESIPEEPRPKRQVRKTEPGPKPGKPEKAKAESVVAEPAATVSEPESQVAEESVVATPKTEEPEAAGPVTEEGVEPAEGEAEGKQE
jgi:large subunit ribosomal protein L22